MSRSVTHAGSHFSPATALSGPRSGLRALLRQFRSWLGATGSDGAEHTRRIETHLSRRNDALMWNTGMTSSDATRMIDRMR